MCAWVCGTSGFRSPVPGVAQTVLPTSSLKAEAVIARINGLFD
jgi:hypothetical protein